MTNRPLILVLGLVTFAYMAGFAALYIDRILPVFQAIGRALGG